MSQIKITQLKSRIGATKPQKATLDALGLRKINKTVLHTQCPSIMGMVTKVKHLVKVESI